MKFRLRTLLVVITALCLGLGAYQFLPGLRYGDVLEYEVLEFAFPEVKVIVKGAADAKNQKRLNALRDRAVKAFPSGSWGNFGPDSRFRTIRLTCRRGVIELQSWHPIYEENPSLVAASYGLTSLNGQTRQQFLSKDDRSYVRKRDAFDALEEQLRRLEK